MLALALPVAALPSTPAQSAPFGSAWPPRGGVLLQLHLQLFPWRRTGDLVSGPLIIGPIGAFAGFSEPSAEPQKLQADCYRADLWSRGPGGGATPWTFPPLLLFFLPSSFVMPPSPYGCGASVAPRAQLLVWPH